MFVYGSVRTPTYLHNRTYTTYVLVYSIIHRIDESMVEKAAHIILDVVGGPGNIKVERKVEHVSNGSAGFWVGYCHSCK